MCGAFLLIWGTERAVLIEEFKRWFLRAGTPALPDSAIGKRNILFVVSVPIDVQMMFIDFPSKNIAKIVGSSFPLSFVPKILENSVVLHAFLCIFACSIVIVFFWDVRSWTKMGMIDKLCTESTRFYVTELVNCFVVHDVTIGIVCGFHNSNWFSWEVNNAFLLVLRLWWDAAQRWYT